VEEQRRVVGTLARGGHRVDQAPTARRGQVPQVEGPRRTRLEHVPRLACQPRRDRDGHLVDTGFPEGVEHSDDHWPVGNREEVEIRVAPRCAGVHHQHGSGRETVAVRPGAWIRVTAFEEPSHIG
jgi:hypothetical protein